MGRRGTGHNSFAVRRNTWDELLRDAYISGSYLTVDRWASEDAFRSFRKAT